MKIGIVGIGAVGSFIISQLLEEHDLGFFNRSPKENVEFKTFYKYFRKSIFLSDADKNTIEYDWIIVCVKEHQTNSIVKVVKQLSHSNTKLAVIRNGMELKDPFLEIISDDRILPCSIDCSIQPDKEGLYRQKSDAKIIMPKSEIAEEFQSLFLATTIEFMVVKDFHTQLWKKIIESSALGGVMATTKRCCEVFREDRYETLFEKLVLEGIDVAKADNAKLPFYFFNALKQKLENYPKDKGCSMLTDVLAGQKVELGAKNGFISMIGRKYGVRTEEHDRICAELGF